MMLKRKMKSFQPQPNKTIITQQQITNQSGTKSGEASKKVTMAKIIIKGRGIVTGITISPLIIMMTKRELKRTIGDPLAKKKK